MAPQAMWPRSLDDPTRRQRSFGHVPVFWAWLAQILEGNPSRQRALALIQVMEAVTAGAKGTGN